jgi:phosphoglycerate dehydrogenase-like enzyme
MLRQPDRATLLAHLPEADYFISERTGLIEAEMIRAAPRLKLIQRLGSLTYDIDTAAAQAAGVAVCYWPVGSVIRVAEHLIMQMLVLGKRLREAEAIALAASTEWGPSRRSDEDTFAYNWSGRQGVGGLWQKTIGIMGFGEIGAELARRLKGWDCTVLYNKRRRLPTEVELELGLTYVDSDTLFSQSDYIANLLPYFKNTDLMINADFLAKMKTGAVLVSCGSGSVIDEAALAAAIQAGKLSGAALDTYEWEPIKADNPLIALAKQGYNVLLTPHTAAGDTAAAAQERFGDYTNLVNHINGRPLKYRVV